VTLGGCASGGGSFKSNALSFLNTYDEAKNKYERGEIMEARATVLAIEKEHEDYARAQALLKNTIEPARLRLLSHYKAKAQAAERARQWDEAEARYRQTAEISIKPELFIKQAEAMNLNLRQLRLESLLKQRREEDAQWLKWSESYTPPAGLNKDDEAYHRMQEYVQEDLESRNRRSLREGWRYLKRGMVGVAYIEAVSVLHLEPESERAQVLMRDIKKNWPTGLTIPQVSKQKTSVQAKRKTRQLVSEEQVQELIRQGQWLKARNQAEAYQRQGGKHADALLEKANAGAQKQAAADFSKGMAAFRKEDIAGAVQLWQQAVTLQPDSDEYIDALRRASQLQERLQLLRDGKGN